VHGGVGELQHVRLADDDRSRAPQPFDNGRIVVRHVVGQHPRAGRRANAVGREKVLDRDRDAVQWAAIATCQDLALGFSRVVSCLLGEDGDEDIERVVERLDARQDTLRHFHW
jgi:hypothetical protein